VGGLPEPDSAKPLGAKSAAERPPTGRPPFSSARLNHFRTTVHEFSIAESVIEQVYRHRPAGAVVRIVRLEAGPLRGIVPDAIIECTGVGQVIADAIQAGVHRHIGEAEQADDITLLVVKRAEG